MAEPTNTELAEYLRSAAAYLDKERATVWSASLRLAAQRLEGNDDVRSALMEALRLINVAFREYAVIAAKFIPDEEKRNFEFHFAAPARNLVNRARAAIEAAAKEA